MCLFTLNIDGARDNKSSTIINKDSCFGSRILGFEAPDNGEIDIPEDFKRVEFYLNSSVNSIHQYLKTQFE